jgi:hypothetical protein
MGNVEKAGLPVPQRLQIAEGLLAQDEPSATYKIGATVLYGNVTVTRQESGWLIEYSSVGDTAHYQGHLAFSLSHAGEIKLAPDKTSPDLQAIPRLPEQILSRLSRAPRGVIEHKEETGDTGMPIFDSDPQTRPNIERLFQSEDTIDMSADQLREIEETFLNTRLEISAGKITIECPEGFRTINHAESQIDGPTVGVGLNIVDGPGTNFLIGLSTARTGEKPFNPAPLSGLTMVDPAGIRYRAKVLDTMLSFELPTEGKFTFSIEPPKS